MLKQFPKMVYILLKCLIKQGGINQVAHKGSKTCGEMPYSNSRNTTETFIPHELHAPSLSPWYLLFYWGKWLWGIEIVLCDHRWETKDENKGSNH